MTEIRTGPGPRVSVIMAAYNAEPFIRTAIDSALAQTMSSLEVVVADDGSTDNTCAIVEAYSRRDPKVKLVRGTAQKSGPARTRNRAIAAARGDWIAILDSDDWYAEERLTTLLDAAEAEKAALVADNKLFVRGENAQPHRYLVPLSKSGPRLIGVSALLSQDKIGRTGSLGLLKPIIRREKLVEHGISYDETLHVSEDFYFLLDCLRCFGPLLLISEPHYFYRTHASSISTSPSVPKLIPLLKVQERHAALFDPAAQPTTARLMHERTRQLERYIRYKTVVDPLRSGDAGSALRRFIEDPAVLLSIIQGFARHLDRCGRVYWTQIRECFSSEARTQR